MGKDDADVTALKKEINDLVEKFKVAVDFVWDKRVV